MIVRKLLAAALGAAVIWGAFAVADATSAAPPRKGGGVGICVSVPPPECNFFLRPVCTNKSACGGCLKWACMLGSDGKS
jgi:hypothetical protein